MSANPLQRPLFEAPPANAPAAAPPPAPSPQRPALWLCLQLAQLPVEVFAEHESELPFAVLDRAGARTQVRAVSEAAAALGVEPGMTGATALARAPELLTRHRDTVAEARRLDWVARWCARFASWISVQRPDTVFLEIAGSLRLFGGLEALHRSLRVGLRVHGHTARSAVAPTPRAALWLSRCADGTAIEAPERLASALESLPVEVLDLDARDQRRLRAIGVHRIGDLSRLPRDGLTRRFGRTLMQQLDAAYGRRPEPLPCLAEAEHFAADVELPLPSDHTAHLIAAATPALERLRHYLRARDLNVDGIDCRLYHERQPATALRIGSRQPTRCADWLRTLLQDRLDRLQLPAPVVALRIEVSRFLPANAQTVDGFDPKPADSAWPELLDRLRARLGDGALIRPGCCADHRPERAHAHDSPVAPKAPPNPRPLWLLAEPEALAVHQGRPWRHGPLRCLRGPERIEQGWWDGHDISRDYYEARDARGNRLWIFQDRQRLGWYLHGWFA